LIHGREGLLRRRSPFSSQDEIDANDGRDKTAQRHGRTEELIGTHVLRTRAMTATSASSGHKGVNIAMKLIT
jgi:hypothetical protein